MLSLQAFCITVHGKVKWWKIMRKCLNSIKVLEEKVFNSEKKERESDPTDPKVWRLEKKIQWQTGQLGSETPRALSNTMFWLLTQHFGLWERQEHHQFLPEDRWQWKWISYFHQGSYKDKARRTKAQTPFSYPKNVRYRTGKVPSQIFQVVPGKEFAYQELTPMRIFQPREVKSQDQRQHATGPTSYIADQFMPFREDTEVGLLIGTNCVCAIKP